MDGYDVATCNAEVDAGSIRRETHNGRDHLVAPVVAVRSMVLKGEFLPPDEIDASLPAWNGRVLPIGHPTDDEGEFVSANSPEVHDAQSVGTFFGAERSDDALVGEVWVDVDESRRLASETADERFVKPLAILASHAEGVDAANLTGDLPPALDAASNAEPGDVLEVSTAYFYRRQDAMGTHDGQTYEATQHDIRPDHLALLPNSEGECSAADGCGAPRVHVHANVEPDGSAADDSGDGTPTGEQATVSNFAGLTMDDDDIEWLVSHTEFDRETLSDFEDSHLETLKASVEAADGSHDDSCACNECTDDTEQAQNDADDDALPEAVEAELSAIRSEVEDLRSERDSEREQRASEAAQTIAANSTRFENEQAVLDALGDDPEALEEIAADFESLSTPADMSGRVGANATPGGGDDEDADDYLDMAVRANEARFGTPEADD